MRRIFTHVICATVIFVFCLTTPAAQLAYEPFDYPAGSTLLGKTNGLGFVGSWGPGGFNAQIDDVFTIQPGALTYPGLAMTGSNHVAVLAVGVQGIAGMMRFFPTNLAVAGSTYYLSFLHRSDAASGFASVVLGTGNGNELSIGKSSSVNKYHISNRGGNKRVYSDAEPIMGTAALLVVKMEFRDGADRFILFVNPKPGQPEPASQVVKEDLDLFFADRIYLYSQGAWSIDEIRLGTTWSDVTPSIAVLRK